MKEDNNPFRPTLSKPVDDSVLATDPHADNFLAGNDRLAHQQRVTMDVVNNAVGAPHLDQMNMSGADTPAVGQPADVTTALNDMSNVSTAEPGGVMTGATGPTVQPTASIFDGLSDGKKGKKKNKKHLLGRKKKAAEVKPTPVSPAAAAESVFGSSLDFGKTDSAHSQHDTTTTAGSANSITSSLNGTHNTDVLTHAGATGTPDAKPADAAGDLLGNLGNLGSTADLTDGGNTDSHDKADDASSPIGASLAAAAAAAADGKTGGVEITPAKDVGKTKAAKNGQPKQLTVSVLTIIFFVLFIGAGAAAVYFGIQNNKNVNALSDAQAELQQLKDQNADSSNSANKESTQFDALQDRIKELTTDNDNKQKTIDENKTTIDNLNKQVTDLTKQVTDANNKLTSDTTVSDKMQSLITTMCASPDFAASSVCIDANGGNAGAVQPTPQQ